MERCGQHHPEAGQHKSTQSPSRLRHGYWADCGRCIGCMSGRPALLGTLGLGSDTWAPELSCGRTPVTMAPSVAGEPNLGGKWCCGTDVRPDPSLQLILRYPLRAPGPFRDKGRAMVDRTFRNSGHLRSTPPNWGPIHLDQMGPKLAGIGQMRAKFASGAHPAQTVESGPEATNFGPTSTTSSPNSIEFDQGPGIELPGIDQNWTGIDETHTHTHTRLGPNLARLLPNWPWTQSNSTEVALYYTKIGPSWTNVGPSSTIVGPRAAKSDQLWSGVCQTWADFGRIRPNVDRNWPHSTNNGPGTTKFGPKSAKLGRPAEAERFLPADVC